MSELTPFQKSSRNLELGSSSEDGAGAGAVGEGKGKFVLEFLKL